MGEQTASCFSSIMTGDRTAGTNWIGVSVDPRNWSRLF